MALFRVPLDRLSKIGQPTLSTPLVGGIIVGIWFSRPQMWQSFRPDVLRVVGPCSVMPNSTILDRFPESVSVSH